MLRKHQLESHLLTNYKTRSKTNSLKDTYNYTAKFQRNKQELVHQILSYHIDQQDYQKQTYKENDFNSKSIVDRYEQFNHENRYFTNAAYLSNKQEIEHQCLNEYIKEHKNNKKTINSKQLIKSINSQDERYVILDKFVKKIDDRITKISQNQNKYQGADSIYNNNHQKTTYSNKLDSKINNQSTMVLTKYYKPEFTHHIKIRKTEIIDRSQSKQKSKSKQQDFSNSSMKQHSHIKISQIINNNNSKVKSDTIKPNDQPSQKIKREYESPSLFNLSNYSSSQTNNNKKQFSLKLSSNSNLNTYKISQQKISEQTHKNNPKKITISLNKSKKDSAKQFNSAECQQIRSFDENQQRPKKFNYDESSNIFDKIEEKKPIDTAKMKEFFNDAPLLFKIKNEDKFKKDVIMENSKHVQKKIKITEKPKEDLFNGCSQLSYRRHLNKQTVHPLSPMSDQSLKQYQFQQSSSCNQNKSKWNQRQGSLKISQPEKIKNFNIQQKKQNQKQKSFENNKIQKADSVKIGNSKINQVAKQVNIDQISMKPQLSEHSSSCSFLQQKQEVTEKRISNINSIVSKAVKTVTLNLQKAQLKEQEITKQPSPFRSKLIQHQIIQPKLIQPKLIQIRSSVQISQKAAQHPKQSFQKIFGQANKAKPQQQSSQSANFFSQLPNCNISSRPSSVEKIEYKQDDNSEMMNQIKDLQSYSIDEEIFRKDHPTSQVQIEMPLPQQKQIQHQIQHQKSKQGSIIVKPSSQSIQSERSFKPITSFFKIVEPNYHSLKEISIISEDAISLSKLESDIEENLIEQESQNIQQNSIQIKKESEEQKLESEANQQHPEPLKQQIEVVQQQQPIIQQSHPLVQSYPLKQQRQGLISKKQNDSPKPDAVKNQKVKRIEIQSSSQSSSDENSQESSQNAFKHRIDNSEVDFDDLQNYDSDEQQQEAKTQLVKKVQPTISQPLAPVIQEDLQQSQFQKKFSIKPTQSIKESSTNKQIPNQLKLSEYHEFEDSFLKDLQKESVKQYKI